MSTRTIRATILTTLLSVAASGVLATQPDDAVEGPFTDWGRTATKLPESTTAGTWDGTWYHVSRDFRVALWFRTVEGAPQLKLQYMSLAIPEGFLTDWETDAEYVVRENPGKFDLDLERRDAGELAGSWHWVLTAPEGTRTETAKIRFYRAGDGRYLVLQFEDFERKVDRDGKVTRLAVKPVWTFEKASNRLALWDELPF